jgi:hypothetical protein
MGNYGLVAMNVPRSRQYPLIVPVGLPTVTYEFATDYDRPHVTSAAWDRPSAANVGHCRRFRIPPLITGCVGR